MKMGNEGPVARPAALPTEASPASGPTNRRRAALRFDADGMPFPAPLVDVVVAGHPTSMIVDTGASHHVVADWLAQELALPVALGGDRATDHTGRALQIARVENVNLAVSGWGRIDAPLLLVAPLPEGLRRLGIGGILAPQLLTAGDHATLLDLRKGIMVDETVEEALRDADTGGGAKVLSGARVCGGPTEGMVLLTQATVEGQDVWLKLDSGASSSSLLDTSTAGRGVMARAGGKSASYAASGKFTSRTLKGAKIKVGELETVVDLDIGPGASAPSCPSDGFLGMDLLRSCVLVLRGAETTGRCLGR